MIREVDRKSEKISEVKSLFLSFFGYWDNEGEDPAITKASRKRSHETRNCTNLKSQDLSFERNSDIAGNDRKTCHLLPRGARAPFPIPTITSNVEIYFQTSKALIWCISANISKYRGIK